MHLLDVVPFHKAPLGNFYYIVSKHIVLSCSHDKSIVVYQLPMYFPGEMMRGEDMNRSRREKEKEKNQDSADDLSEEERQLREKEFLNSSNVIDKVQESLISKTAVLRSKKLMEREYTDWEKNCEDINGWDN